MVSGVSHYAPVPLDGEGKKGRKGKTGLPCSSVNGVTSPRREGRLLLRSLMGSRSKKRHRAAAARGELTGCANSAFLEWTEKRFQNPKVNGTLLHYVDEGK